MSDNQTPASFKFEIPDLTGKSSVEKARLIDEALASLPHEVRQALKANIGPGIFTTLFDKVVSGDLDGGLREAEGIAEALSQFHTFAGLAHEDDHSNAAFVAFWSDVNGNEEPRSGLGELVPQDEKETDPFVANGVASVLLWEWGRLSQRLPGTIWRVRAARGISGLGPSRMGEQISGCMAEILFELANEIFPLARVALRKPLQRARSLLKSSEWEPFDEDDMPEALEADAEFCLLARGESLAALRTFLAHRLRHYNGDLAIAELRCEFASAASWGLLLKIPQPKSDPPPTGEAALLRLSPKRTAVTVAEANTKATALLVEANAEFLKLSKRKQAKKIGCSFDTWSKTPLYKALEKRQPQSQPPPPSVVGLTDKLEARHCAKEMRRDPSETLDRLIEEQQADNEISPLEDDPPDLPPKRTKHYRQL